MKEGARLRSLLSFHYDIDDSALHVDFLDDGLAFEEGLDVLHGVGFLQHAVLFFIHADFQRWRAYSYADARSRSRER